MLSNEEITKKINELENMGFWKKVYYYGLIIAIIDYRNRRMKK